MTRERAKELLPIITAWVSGKTIQVYNDNGMGWIDVHQNDRPLFTEGRPYRIKPEEHAHVFKPFDRVLARDYDDQNWICDIYSNKSTDPIDDPFLCIGQNWCQCIPYEGNEHLLGTMDKPKGEE